MSAYSAQSLDVVVTKINTDPTLRSLCFMVGDGQCMDQPRAMRANHSGAGWGHCMSLVSSFSDPLSNTHLLKLSLVSTVSCSFWQLLHPIHVPYLAHTHLLSADHLPVYLPNRTRFSVTHFVSFTALPPEAAFCINTCLSPLLFSLGP